MTNDAFLKQVQSDGETIAHVYDLGAATGKSFPTPDSFPFQFGFGVVNEEWTSPAHIHKPVMREVEGTAEFIFILTGRLDVVFFDDNEREVGRDTLTEKMALLQIKGGHKLTFAKGTTYLELKQGPYKGREWDKYEL